MVKQEAPGDENDRFTKRQKIVDDLGEKILKQVEYYFSDVNVIKDKFLKIEFGKNDGWVDIATLIKFKRLENLTQDQSKIAEALENSESDVIEFNKEKNQVKRKNPIPDAEEYQKQVDKRTVHISGFPTNYEFESLRSFCGQYGDIESLHMRRYFKTRLFKGCVHVTYKRVEDAEKVMKAEYLKCKDRELRKESMEEYFARKAEMAEKRREKKAARETQVTTGDS